MRTLLPLAALILTPRICFADVASGPRVTIPLDGAWQIAEGQMAAQPERFEASAPVPGLADLATPAFADVGVASPRRQAFWYRRTFTVPGPAREVALLKVTKAQFGTKVWLNGSAVGEHLGCFTPGYFDLSGALRYGAENTLLIRVGADRSAVPPGVPTNTDYEESKWIPGIYDSVVLILSGSPRVVSLQVAPRLATGSALVQAALETRAARPQSARVRFSVREWRSGRPVATPVERTVTLSPGRPRLVTAGLRLTRPHLWSPEDPFLYVVRCETGGDAVEARFGMREFRYDQKSGRAMLNGRPYYLRGTDFCMFRFFEDPIRGGLPWDHAWARRLLTLPKGVMHWNSARVCIAPFPEFWYDLADEIGWLLQDEFPIWGFHEEWSQEELATEFKEWLQERWNHPSLAVWDACNETLTPRTGQLIRRVRGRDLSRRPWDDGYAPPNRPGDAVEHHPYTVLGSGGRWDPSALGSALDRSVPIRPGPVVLNEYDTFWLQRDGTPAGGYAGFYAANLGPDATAADRREALAYNGAAVSEYWRARRDAAGVQWFCYLTYSRPGAVTSDNFVDLKNLVLEPRFVKYVGDAFSPLGVMVDDATPRVAGGPRDYPVIITNDLYQDQSGTLQVAVTDAQEQQTLWRTEAPFRVAALGQSVMRVSVSLPAQPGPCRVVARLTAADGRTVASRRKITVVTPQEARRMVNIARGCPATASSEVTDSRGDCPARFATDGKLGTRWSSEFADPQWIMVDLRQVRRISRVSLAWETAYGKTYRIQVSTDGQAWRDVYSTDQGRGGREDISFAPVDARYVRLWGTARGTQWGYSLWEFEVFED